MEITATEFKKNLGKYLDQARFEDVIITKNGALIAKLTAVRDGGDCDKLYYTDSDPKRGFDSMIGEDLPAETYSANADDEWVLTHNGEPVAKLTPIRKKRKLGFIKGSSGSEKER